MTLKILTRQTLLLIVLTGLMISSVILFYFITQSSIQSDSAPKQEQVSSVLPSRLKIPVINVDAAVEHLGLTSNGEMDVPKGPDDVAWFKLGPRPGENGSAVMAGHYGPWKNGKESVFNDLNKLRKGDKVYIENGEGETISFVVRESRSYDPNTDASDVFNFNDGKPHLNLITCEGVWNETSKTYSKRLVVFTDEE